MQFAFDLISDLHVDSRPGPFVWDNLATSAVCLVAGDISRNHDRIDEVLTELANRYTVVLYIDGNDEHRLDYAAVDQNTQSIMKIAQKHKNVVFLQDKVAVINDVAFVAANGWWTYDLDPSVSFEQAQRECAEYIHQTEEVCDEIWLRALSDAKYLEASVARLQTHNDVRHIVVVSHTVPDAELINHDPDIKGTWRLSCAGNSQMRNVLRRDTEHKIRAWCFGHYHLGVDRVQDNIRWVNNCQGRAGTRWSQDPYYPKRIEIG